MHFASDRANRSTKLMLVAVVLPLLLISFISKEAQAFDNMFVSGFASQGYFVTTENNYLMEDSKTGSFELNEAAINFMTMPVENLRVGVQLYGRDLGQDGNNNINVDWAYGDYRFADYFGVRAGKIKTPMFLFNQYRDIDMARNSVLLPQSIYGDHQRDFALAFEGFDIYGNVDFGGLGDVDYEAFIGNSSVPDPNTGFWQGINTALAQSVASGYIAGTSAAILANIPGMTPELLPSIEGHAEYDSPYVRWKQQFGANFVYNTPVDGLRLGATYMFQNIDLGSHVHGNVEVGDPTLAPLFNSEFEQEFYINYQRTTYGFAIDYTWNQINVVGEYSMFSAEDETNNDPTTKGETDANSYYGMVNYQLMDNLGLFAYYDVNIPNTDNDDSEYWNYQKDIAFGARYDVNSNWLVKFDLHMINGTSNVISFANEDIRKAYNEDWMIFVVKNTFHF